MSSRQNSFFIVFLFLVFSQKISAGACCTSAASFGVGRLLMWEKAAVGLNTSIARDLKYPFSIWRTEAFGMLGITERLSGFALAPWVVPIRYEDDLSMNHNIGDVQSGVRYQVIHIGEYTQLPSLALTSTVTFPTGTPGSKSVPSTGRGIWALGVGASLEKTWMPWFLQLNLGATFPVTEQGAHYGHGGQIAIVGGRELPHDIVISGILGWLYEVPPASQFAHKTSIGMSLAYRFDPHFTWVASVSSDLPFKAFHAELPIQTTVLTGLRCGIF